MFCVFLQFLLPMNPKLSLPEYIIVVYSKPIHAGHVTWNAPHNLHLPRKFLIILYDFIQDLGSSLLYLYNILDVFLLLFLVYLL